MRSLSPGDISMWHILNREQCERVLNIYFMAAHRMCIGITSASGYICSIYVLPFIYWHVEVLDNFWRTLHANVMLSLCQNNGVLGYWIIKLKSDAWRSVVFIVKSPVLLQAFHHQIICKLRLCSFTGPKMETPPSTTVYQHWSTQAKLWLCKHPVTSCFWVGTFLCMHLQYCAKRFLLCRTPPTMWAGGVIDRLVREIGVVGVEATHCTGISQYCAYFFRVLQRAYCFMQFRSQKTIKRTIKVVIVWHFIK